MCFIIFTMGQPMTKSIKLLSFLSIITTFSQAADLDSTQNQNTSAHLPQHQTIELLSPQQHTIKRNSDHAETIRYLSHFLEHRKITDAHFNFLAHLVNDKEKELKKISSQHQTLATRLHSSLALSTELSALTSQELLLKRKAHHSKISQLSDIEMAHHNIYSQYTELLTLQNKYKNFFYQDQCLEEEIIRERKEAQNRKELADYLRSCFREQYETHKLAEEYLEMLATDLDIDSALKIEEEIRDEQLLEQYEKSLESESRQVARSYSESYGWYDSDDEEIFVQKSPKQKSPKKRAFQSPKKNSLQAVTSQATENDENASPNTRNKRIKLITKASGVFSPIQKASSITSNGTTDNELSSQSSIEYRTRQISQDY